jgi:hypothetical protein
MNEEIRYIFLSRKPDIAAMISIMLCVPSTPTQRSIQTGIG